jgi:hypothetical protein
MWFRMPIRNRSQIFHIAWYFPTILETRIIAADEELPEVPAFGVKPAKIASVQYFARPVYLAGETIADAVCSDGVEEIWCIEICHQHPLTEYAKLAASHGSQTSTRYSTRPCPSFTELPACVRLPEGSASISRHSWLVVSVQLSAN